MKCCYGNSVAVCDSIFPRFVLLFFFFTELSSSYSHRLTSLSNPHQVDQILGDEPEVKEKLFTVLKQYAAEKRVEWLASVLPDILTTDEHRQLISSIR